MKMAKPHVILIAFACLCFASHEASSFSINKFGVARRPTLHPKVITDRPIIQPALDQIATYELSTDDNSDSIGANKDNSLQQLLFASCMTFLTTTPLSAFALDELEVEELPPVYVPILFAIAVLGGVGVLTASLGNVMDEEASLGLQSGARAKKERDRSRSSYFKK